MLNVSTDLGYGVLTRDHTGKPVVRIDGRDYTPSEVESVNTKTLGEYDTEAAKLVTDARNAGYAVYC